jgi:peptide deformylase
MGRLPIRLYGDPILRKKAEEIEEIDEDIRKLAFDMLETCKAVSAIGLAGNQVGVAKRIFVVDRAHIDLDEEALVMINPEVVETDGEDLSEEGCMSVPGAFEQVKRPQKIKIRGLNLEGKKLTIEGEGLLARVLMHEMDHLNGLLFIDHLSSVRRQLLSKKLRDISRKGSSE